MIGIFVVCCVDEANSIFAEEEKGQLHRAENEHMMENWKGLGRQDTEGWCLGSKLAVPPVSLESSLGLCAERI